MTTNVLLLCAEAPDARGLGGSAIFAATLAERSRYRVCTAHADGDGLEVWRFGPEPVRWARLPILPARSLLAPHPGLEWAIEAAVAGTDADVVHVQSLLIGPPPLAEALRRLDVGKVLTLHDHSGVCPNYELLEEGRYCGVPEQVIRCDRCLERTRRLGAGSLVRWRLAVREVLDAVDEVVAPSTSVLDHLERAHPDFTGSTRVIEWGVPTSHSDARPRAPGSPLRIAIVGVLSRTKGADRLPDLLRACAHLDVEWHVLGATEGRSTQAIRDAHPRVVVHGAYRRDELGRLLEETGCGVALLPSIVPESFSLVASEVLAAGLPIIASELGALGDRVQKHEVGFTFDPWEPRDLVGIVERLLSEPALLDRSAERARGVELPSEEQMIRAHEALWDEVAPSEPHRGTAAARAAFDRAVVRTAARVDSALRRARQSRFYRDLRLRSLLSEERRRSIQELLRGRR